MNADAAVRLIADGDTVAISGGGYRVVAESLLSALADAHQNGGPTGLTAIAVAMIERSRGGRGGAGTGLNRLAAPGLLSRIISGSYSRSRGSELTAAVSDRQIAAFNYPMGTIVQWLRASAAGRSGLLTTVGLHTFIDPRLEGGVVGFGQPGAREPLNRIVDVDGETMLFYPALEVDVALIKASAADDRGNLYFDQEAFEHGVQDMAMAAHRRGGLVIAEVNRLVKPGEIHPRFGRIPGPLVDVVVVADEPWEDEQDPQLTGGSRHALADVSDRLAPRDVIARIAVDSLAPGAMVNLGAGIPMYDVPEAARAAGRDDLYFTVEQGPMGGWPQAGGVSRLPEMILGQLDVFDFYEGGGPDVSLLSFGQIDQAGNVNVSRFADLMPGCGGFTNIVHGVKNLVFCGTLTTGGLDESIEDGRLEIRTEGRIDRLVDAVEQVTFNGQQALRNGTTVTVVTERGVLQLTPAGFELRSIAPGIDLDRDIRAHIPFPLLVSPDLVTLDPGYFTAHSAFQVR